MAAEDPMAALAVAVSDGVPVDWVAAEAAALSNDELEIVYNLRVISTLGAFHRTDVGNDLDSSAAGPVRLDAAAPLARWGHLALIERLGEGSQGEVYRAIDTRLDREVALKFLKKPAESGDAEHLLSEARLLARVRHANVATVHGADLIEGRVGLWMELIDGETLETLVGRRGPMSAAEAAVVGASVCRAVGAVHQAALLHRDIKAQNVMREAGGRYVLMDFGTGHAASDKERAGRSAGTPLYLAPEVFAGAPASVQSDVYALGVLLFHLVTGSFPVDAQNVPELAEAHRSGQRLRLADVRADLPTAFTNVIERAIQARPEDRYRTVADLAAALMASTSDEAAPTALPPWRPRWRVIAGGLVVAVLGLVGLWIWSRAGPASGPAGSPTVAVLPFEDLSKDGRAAHIAGGLSDLLISDLGHRPFLSVLARTSSAQFVGSRRGLDMARELGVAFLVEGSLQPTDPAAGGERWIVSARVLTAGAGTIVGSRTFTVDMAGLGALPAQMADMVAGVLRLPASTVAKRAAISDPQALEAYFRGWNEYWRLSRPGFVEAERLFRVTTTRAPSFAPGHAALAYVTLQLEKSYRAFPPGEGVASALRSAETAVSLDPSDSQALAALGWTRFYGEWKWREGEEALRRAIDANPSDPQARWMYAQLLMAENRLDAALEEARLVQRLDPLSAARYSNVATVFYYQRRFADAMRASEQILTRDPSAIVGHFGRARFLSALGRHDEAIAMIRSGANATEPPVRAELARILTVAGRGHDARTLLPELEADYRAQKLAPDYYAFLKLARGEPDEALNLLHQAVRERSPSVIWIQVDPRFDALRDRPEFLDVLRLVGLAP